MRRRVVITLSAVIILCIGAYATWYTLHRYAVIAEIKRCENQLAHPESIPKMRAPDGTLVPVAAPCMLGVTPPSFLDLITGHIAFTDVPDHTKVSPYTFWDVALGRYTVNPDITVPCDQPATTTDCSTLPALSQPEPQPYVPPNPIQPPETWDSATGTPISLYGFTFELPAGWHGAVYRSAYTGDVHALVQRDPNGRGFTIDCPPAGKGLEAATRLSSEERSFTSGGIDYSAAFEKWTAPGNDPWYFLWIRTPQSGDPLNGSPGTYCIVQGSATPDIEDAMRTMYESWR